MAWKIENGRPVRTGLTPPEITTRTDAPSTDDLVCPICGKGYQREYALEAHIEKHSEEE